MGENNSLIEVFHEVKNPLATIKINLELLKENLYDHSFDNNLDVISNEINRIDAVLNKYRDYDLQKDLEKDYIFFSEVILSIAEENSITYPDILISVLDNDDVSIMAYEYHIYMIFSNLIKNAIEAMNGIGNIDVRIKKDDGLATIEILDQGVSITENQLLKIKKGGYTSKPNGQGLGTSIVKNICSIYNGTFSLSPRLEVGTKAIVQFPIEE